jgi:hypothetical protein
LVAAWTALLASVLSAPNPAWAASEVELRHASDGTLVVVGSGWHHGALLVSLGNAQFTAYADTAGDFEVATGLAQYHGEVSVQHVDAPRVVSPSVGPSPLGVLIAQSVVEGVALLFVASVLGVLVTRLRYSRRRNA